MTITLTGASGFIGTPLLRKLREHGHQVHALSRSGAGLSKWDPEREEPCRESLESANVVIHLAGEPVAQRWTETAKRRIRDSRVTGTLNLVAALAKLEPRPDALICASAIGIYGDRGDEILTESSSPGAGFLADVCGGWEREAMRASELGMRVVNIRIGIVLGKDGGALKQMLLPFRLSVGGRLGSGRQWMSWIHLDDLVSLFAYTAEQPVSGVLNGVAPNAVTNLEFTRTLAAALRRPAIFPVPEFGLKALFGEMSEVLLGSQRVQPQAAKAAGFEFRHPRLQEALQNILQ